MHANGALDETAREAVAWSRERYAELTRAIDAGENDPMTGQAVDISRLLPEYRVAWSDVMHAFPTLASIEGRFAYDRALNRMGTVLDV